MESEGSLPHSQVPANCPYPEPARSSPYPHLPQTKITFTKIYKCVQFVTVANKNVSYKIPFYLTVWFVPEAIDTVEIVRLMMGV
jgi:hypothetical protein